MGAVLPVGPAMAVRTEGELGEGPAEQNLVSTLMPRCDPQRCEDEGRSTG